MEIDEKYVYAWDNKGLSLDSLGMYEKAVKCYDKALEIDTMDIDALNGKGRALDKLGKHKEAKECYERAKQLG